MMLFLPRRSLIVVVAGFGLALGACESATEQEAVDRSAAAGIQGDAYAPSLGGAEVAVSEDVGIDSARDGDWSSPATWRGGVPPGAEDAVLIRHAVVLDLAKARVGGLTIAESGRLVFSPKKSVLLETDANLLNRGALEMRPAAPTILHRLRFVDVDEARFVGGGMAALDTDVGLWTTGDGVVDAAGAAKTAWTHLAAGAARGNARLTVREAEGWRIGDAIVIAPTESPAVGDRAWNGFEKRTVVGVDGRTVELDGPLDHDHPAVANPFDDERYAAEVLNLTRNVRIEGTGEHSPSFEPGRHGRGHVIFLATRRPQTLKYVELSHLGPRRADEVYTAGVKGRYPLHFHHAHDGSRGSLVEGVVVRQSGNRAFVPHASHGITLRNVIAYDVFETPYWWDQPDPDQNDPVRLNVNNTDDLMIDRAVAARVRSDPEFRGYRLSGYTLTRGKDFSLTIKDSVAVGVQGNIDASGFEWPELGQAVWNFNQGNVAHNNKVDGVFVWQNNDARHEISDFVAYRNGAAGVDHGAYGNVFQYRDLTLFDNGEADFVSLAPAIRPLFRMDGYSQAIERLQSTGAFKIGEHNVIGYAAPTLVKDSVVGRIEVDEEGYGAPGLYDFVNVSKPDGSSIEPSDFTLLVAKPQSVYRVQRPDGTAFRLDGDGSVERIETFYDQPAAAREGASSLTTLTAPIAR